jgi:FkbM family methyltransferase
LADPATIVGRSIQTTGVHDLAVSEILARLIQSGDTVVDAGAHIGYMTTLAAVASGPNGHVLAWEPHPELFRVLDRNVASLSAQHRFARVTLRNAALGSAAGGAALVVPDDNASNDSTSRLVHEASASVRSIRVTVETLDEVLGDTDVGVMKLDVEGSEQQALAGGSQALRAGRIRHIVFEEHRGPTSEVVRFLQSLGYTVFAIGWSIRKPKLGPLSDGTLAAEYEAPSYLATISAREVESRCSTAGWLTLRARFARRT